MGTVTDPDLTRSAVVKHFEEAPTGVKRRNAIEDSAIKAFLDGVLVGIARHRAVEHPFLNSYRTTRLDSDQEFRLFAECFYFFRYMPFYVAGMAMATRDETILREIVFNVAEEVQHDPTHSTLYRQFLGRIGIDVHRVEQYRPLDVTVQLDDGIRRLYTESPISVALGALYADETMASIMVGKINDGLTNQGYDEDTRYFWTLHIALEIGHSNSVFNAIAPYVGTAQTRTQFETGAFAYLSLVEAYWDGVQQLVGI
jgi:pyrroloquinoline quinone (PQQ) biosynthesis protein C